MVCIKDFKMPKNCLECRFYWPGDGQTYCTAQLDFVENWYGLMRYKHHVINFTYHSREEQDRWREETCPLFEVGDNSKVPVDTKTIGYPQGDYDVYCCRNCHIELDRSFSYCPHCGVELEWSDEE